MKKLLALAALVLAAASPAYAGVGATAYMGSTNDGAAKLGFQAPSLDYRASGILAQVQLLDLIGELPNKNLELGVGVSGVVVKKKIGENIEGVFMPGGILNVSTPTSFNNLGWQILAQGRFGMEMKNNAGFGVYVVPVAGVSNFTGNVGLSYGGTLQVSVWFANDGGGGGGDGKGKGKKGKRNK